jgi:hypothetical protein
LRAYIATRLATAVLVILGVSLVSFLLTFLTGDPAEIMLPPGATGDQIAVFRAAWGFDDPLPVQYWRFLSRAVHGDFGLTATRSSSLPLIDARARLCVRDRGAARHRLAAAACSRPPPRRQVDLPRWAWHLSPVSRTSGWRSR